MKKIPLYLQIIIGMVIGILWGILSGTFDGGIEFTIKWIAPFGTIFIRLLKLLAIPLIFTSLICAVSSLKDIKTLGRLGGRTLLVFLFTAVCATSTGLIIANIIKPGKNITPEIKQTLFEKYGQTAEHTIIKTAHSIGESPLQPIVEMVPDNIFFALSNNQLMLQVVFFSVLAGIALLYMEKTKAAPLVNFLESLNELFGHIVRIVMYAAPFGVFALISSLIADLSYGAGHQLIPFFYSLALYMGCVIAGLLIILFIIYPAVFTYFSRTKYFEFFRMMRPALLMGFSTSSSSATLPVTLDRVKNNLKVKEEIADFVLPMGTTINMDGTALYQSVAVVFVAQALGISLGFTDMIAVVLTATLAAAGAAGVPGAGMVTLVIVMESVGVPAAAGIALIMPPDRLLDMCRTVVNVAGDATAALVVEGSKNQKL